MREADLTGLTVGRASEDDSHDLLRLINAIQPHQPWNEQRLRWQYFEPPPGPARVYTLRSGSEIIAQYAAIPHWVSVRGRVVRAWMVQDVMTLPAYRGRGLLHHLGSLCAQDTRAARDYGFTFPNALSMRSFRREGWTELMPVPFRRCATSEAGAARSARLTPVEPPFDDAVSEIWRGSGLALGIRKDKSYLDWRYRKPGRTYSCFLVDGDRGLLILKLYKEGSACSLDICELLLREDSRSLAASVLGSCLEFAREAGASDIASWLPASHPLARDFDALGFGLLTVPDRFVFVLGPEHDPAGLATPEAWHLSAGDSDVY